MTEKKEKKTKKTGLELLREPFDDNQIGKLPKPLAWQTKKYKEDKSTGGKCMVCGGYHHKDVIHLDYVGHAALTDKLLDCDPKWTWKPVAFTDLGLPAFDQSGGLWIELTVLDVTRYGYGHAAGSEWKDIGSREKEVIGDALRNAAMRFGAALDLWHKGDLHADDEGDEMTAPKKPKGSHNLDKNIRPFLSAILSTTSLEEFKQVKIDYKEPLNKITKEWPEYMTECQSEEQTKTYNDQITDHKKRLQSDKDMYEQQEKDFVNPLQ